MSAEFIEKYVLAVKNKTMSLDPNDKTLPTVPVRYRTLVKDYKESLERLINNKWQEIKDARDDEEQSGCPYLGKKIDSDKVSIIRINTAVCAATEVPTLELDWTMQDNTVQHMTNEQVKGMSLALAYFSNTLHEKARVLREKIEAISNDATLTTDQKILQIKAIEWIKS